MQSPTDEYRRELIRRTLSEMGPKFQGEAAEVMLAAIAYQESAFFYRRQIKGPARGFWQFEQGGGVAAVMQHPSSKKYAMEAVKKHPFVQWNTRDIYNQLELIDKLACKFARLLLWTDAKPLPTDPAEAWDYYIRNWRPGKPHKHTWGINWVKALELMKTT
jgi:hypothetical protein